VALLRRFDAGLALREIGSLLDRQISERQIRRCLTDLKVKGLRDLLDMAGERVGGQCEWPSTGLFRAYSGLIPGLFRSYSHADDDLRNELESPSRHFATELQISNIVLLLVSVDFLSSEYCHEIEMQQAMERHERGDAKVIPVILRPCDWEGAPFGRLLAVPTNGKPVTKHTSLDNGFLEVAQAVRQAAESFEDSTPQAPNPAVAVSTAKTVQANLQAGSPRSSNLAVPKEFTDREQ